MPGKESKETATLTKGVLPAFSTDTPRAGRPGAIGNCLFSLTSESAKPAAAAAALTGSLSWAHTCSVSPVPLSAFNCNCRSKAWEEGTVYRKGVI